MTVLEAIALAFALVVAVSVPLWLALRWIGRRLEHTDFCPPEF